MTDTDATYRGLHILHEVDDAVADYRRAIDNHINPAEPDMPGLEFLLSTARALTASEPADGKRKLVADFCRNLTAKIEADPDMSYDTFTDMFSDMIADLDDDWPEGDD